MPEGEAVRTAAALADALAALHDAGYLHGDVKPSNIGFTAGGSPKLLDFGLARGAGSAAAGGTLRYASPEILSDRPAGEGDDVWSLCVVLYEMVSGEHPFAGGSADEVAGRGAADAGDRIRGGDPPGRAVGPARHGARLRRSPSERRRGRRVKPLTRRPFGFRLSYVSIKNALDTAPLWGGAGRRCVSAEGSSASSRQQSGRRPVCGSWVVRPGGRHVSMHETV